jgi:hypothetical protein
MSINITDFTQVNEELENWRNYYCDRTKQRVTFSLEGRYKPQRSDFDYEESELEPPPAPPSKPVNVSLATKYEIAITKLPQYPYEACLVIEYMYKWALNERHFNKTCRIAKVKPSEWNETVKKAKLMLINRMR